MFKAGPGSKPGAWVRLGLRKTVSPARIHGLGPARAGLGGLSVKNIINSSTVAMRQHNIIKFSKLLPWPIESGSSPFSIMLSSSASSVTNDELGSTKKMRL